MVTVTVGTLTSQLQVPDEIKAALDDEWRFVGDLVKESEQEICSQLLKYVLRGQSYETKEQRRKTIELFMLLRECLSQYGFSFDGKVHTAEELYNCAL